MAFLNNVKIPAKIIALLLMLGSITLLVAWRGSAVLLSTGTEASRQIDVTAANTTTLSRFHQRITGMMYNSYKVLNYDGASAPAKEAAAQVEKDYQSAADRLANFRKVEPDAPEIPLIADALGQVRTITSQAIAAALADRNADARVLLAKADALDRDYSPKIRIAIDARSSGMAASAKAMSSESRSTSTILLTIAVASVIAGIALALFVVRIGITGPLKILQVRMGEIAAGDHAKPVDGNDRGDEVGAMARAVQVFRENGIAKAAADTAKARADAEQKMVVDTVSAHLSHLSDGDVTAAITADFPGEYAVLKSNFNEALEKLRELVGGVSESASAIRTGSGEIAQASEDLARRTESNAASLEETAASITQMDGRLRASAQAAARTVERADQAIATVGGGRAVADEAVQAMGRVSDSAKGIDSVIEGLDKIAFQTRVLAMNAAVEAGRAGDAGRGFAVVADLVSALAMRAEEEAKRARDQLTLTQTDIVTAVDAVTKVDEALANISGDVSQVHDLLATMAVDNQAQSAAITQISAAIGTMDQSTQQNAAMVEETSAAARNLVAEVGSLADQASRFKVARGGGGTSRRHQPDYVTPAAYASPVRPLPTAAIPALVRADDDWKSF